MAIDCGTSAGLKHAQMLDWPPYSTEVLRQMIHSMDDANPVWLQQARANTAWGAPAVSLTRVLPAAAAEPGRCPPTASAREGEGAMAGSTRYLACVASVYLALDKSFKIARVSIA